MIRTTYKYNLTAICLVAVLLISCGKEDADINEPGPVQTGSELIIDTRAADISDNNYQLMKNLHLYAFDGNTLYKEKVAIQSTSGNKLTAQILPGKWNLVAVSCIDQDIRSRINLPGANRKPDQLMWQMQESETGDYMEEMPELLYGIIPDLQVVKPQTAADVDLIRNVARIDVILEHQGFDTDFFENYPELCYFELHKVPTSLSWEGKLLPERDKPYISQRPLKQLIRFNANAEADTIRFIVPAHRGDDFDAPMADIEDYSRHTLFIQGCLPDPENEGIGFLAEKTNPEGVEIPIPLKMNRVLEVKFRFFGPGAEGLLDVKVTPKAWDKTEINEVF